MLDEQDRREADRLYWETDASVAEIADRMAISRRALYDAIQPRTLDVLCTACGAALVFRNRTAAERRQAECMSCEVAVEVEAAAGPGGPPASPGTSAARPDVLSPDTSDAAEPEVEQERTAARLSPLGRGRAAVEGHGALIGGSLLAGLTVGAAVGYLLRRR